MTLLYGLTHEAYKACRLHKFMPELKALTKNQSINLFAVKNQSVAFQVLLASDEDFAVSITDNTYFDKKGLINQVRVKAVLEDKEQPLDVTMNIIGFVEDDDRIMKADILLRNESMFVEAKNIQPIWTEIQVPDTVLPGCYQGWVEVFWHQGFEAEKCIGKMSFSLEVSPVILQEPKDYHFFLDLWQHNANIARKHEVPLWSDSHFQVIENYLKTLGALGQKAVTVIVSEIPWSGQYCHRDYGYLSDFYEYNMIKVYKSQEGQFYYDFSILDRYISLCAKYGIKEEIEVMGLINIWMSEEEGYGKVILGYSDGIRIRYKDELDGCFKYMDTVDALILYIQAIEAHFIQNGLIDNVRVTADEPADFKLFNERLTFIKKVAPQFRYKAAIDHAEFITDTAKVIDDFVPIFSALCAEYNEYKALSDVIKGKLCWYVCCKPEFPNNFIKSEIVESYAIGWLTHYMGLSGFLRWNYTVWPEDPRNRVAYRSGIWQAGDTHFVYPSNNGTPLLSLRYKGLLKGIQMFELIQQLEALEGKCDILEKAYGYILRTRNISDFAPENKLNKAMLLSPHYEDYMQAFKTIAEGLSN